MMSESLVLVMTYMNENLTLKALLAIGNSSLLFVNLSALLSIFLAISIKFSSVREYSRSIED